MVRPDPEAVGRAAGEQAGPLPPDLAAAVLAIAETPRPEQTSADNAA